MPFQVRSPKYEREAIDIPGRVEDLSGPFNGTVSSAAGDEYPIRNNIVDLLVNKKEYSVAQGTNHWKLTASFYEDLWRKRSLSFLTGEEFPIEKEKELLLKWMAPRSGGVYLDVGCSTALYARTMKKAHPDTLQVALDFSDPMLLEARLKAEADETDILFLKADAREMPFFGQTFDGLMMGGTLNELTDELKVLYECRRVIKKDGVMFMMHLIKSDHWGGRLIQESVELSGIHFWTIPESNTLFERAGFRIDEQFSKGIVCFTKLRPM